MKKDYLPSINNQIYRQFPEFSGVQPSIQKQASSNNSTDNTTTNYVFIYSIQAHVGNNKSLTRVVRAVVNEQGKILKITTSR
jgi:hypothetical protein